MKKRISLLVFSALAVFALLVVMPSCEGPEGPAGEDGVAGVDGTDGTDGVDANSFCIECHNMDTKNSIKTQYTMSGHGSPGFALGYAGARGNCAMCHSHQGFMETTMTGRDTIGNPIGIPVAFQCETCHDFHGTLDETEFPDYALRNDNPVSLIYNGHATTVDLAGTGNVCAYCHQPRPREDFPLEVNGEAMVAVTSSHWGTHYGTASVILAGQEAFEVPGSLTYENTAHATTVGCADCHMYKNEDRADVGGHTFKMTAEDEYQNVASCQECHSGATDFNLNGVQDEVAGLIHELDVLLMEHKLVDETGHAIPHDNEAGKGDLWTSNEAGAVYNLLLAHYEGSHGVHNYKYTKALLTNTIEMVEAW